MKNKNKKNKIGISLFCSSGIGDLGLKANNIKIVIANEIIKERANLFKINYPDTKMFNEDIRKCKKQIIEFYKKNFSENPFIIFATPPCQGMSFNSIGKRLQKIKKEKTYYEDPRNKLIIPALEIIKKLKPKWVIFENVEGMLNTTINVRGSKNINIIQYIKKVLCPEYVGIPEIVNCADYGIPQTRIRLITIFTRGKKGKKHFKRYKSFLPEKTHSEFDEKSKKSWVTLKDAIYKLPKLSSRPSENQDLNNYWHYVPIISKEKYWWIKNTPPNDSAFNNQCVKCGYSKNPIHGMRFVKGRHTYKDDTPIYCKKCGALLPRPTMYDKKTGERRRIKGFDSAYRRMSWNSPAPTLTQNMQAICSDKKIHPIQNRPLSLFEGMILQTITDYPYEFSNETGYISHNLCCKIIGESVPPKLIDKIVKNILLIENHEKYEK